MRFMIIVKANADSENDVVPSSELIAAMGRFNDELINAGVLLAGEGLTSSRHGARVRYQGGKFSVTDGPFAESKELIAGFWIVDVRDRDEAIAWVKKIPFGEGEEIEIRKVVEAADWAEAGIDPQLIEKEQAQREALSRRSDGN